MIAWYLRPSDGRKRKLETLGNAFKSYNLCRMYSLNGKIYSIEGIDFEKPPLHQYYRCEVLPMKAVIAGNATKDRENGADFWIKYYGKLPDYYISSEELELLGWKWGKSPRKFAPGKNDN